MNKNPFYFRKDTPEEVKIVIQKLYENKHRARFTSTAKSEKWIEFMQGKRFSK